MLGNHSCFCCHLLTFLKIHFFKEQKKGMKICSACKELAKDLTSEAKSIHGPKIAIINRHIFYLNLTNGIVFYSRTPDWDFSCFYPCKVLSYIPVPARGKDKKNSHMPAPLYSHATMSQIREFRTVWKPYHVFPL